MQLKLGLTPRARGTGSVPKGCPEITAPAFSKLSMDEDVRLLPNFRNWPSRVLEKWKDTRGKKNLTFIGNTLPAPAAPGLCCAHERCAVVLRWDPGGASSL